MTDQPPRPHPRPGARHPRRPWPAALRALTVLCGLLLSFAVVAPPASATEPPPGPPPPPPAVTAPGLPLWAVLVILGGTITLAAATTLITLALHSTATRHRPRPPARTPAKARHQPLPPARPASRHHTSAAIPPTDTGP